MGSRKSALQLWRKKETDWMRVLRRLRLWECHAFQSHQSKPHQFLEKLGSGSTKHSSVNANNITKVILGNNEIPLLHRRKYARDFIIGYRSPSQVMKNYGPNSRSPCLVRFMSSQASKESGKSANENKKDISKVEDPFDAPTYNIPEKPVTFAEGTSYFFIILAGLGIASAAAYSVFKELIFEQKEYTIFNKSLKRIQDDAGVRVRIGYPITGYGQESRNRAARQRIPYRNWTDENGVEHVEVNFYIRGPHGAGKVFSEMYKDLADRQWKFTYLLVEIRSPSPAQLILESYLPAYSPELAASK